MRYLGNEIKELIVQFLKEKESCITCYNCCTDEKEIIDKTYKCTIYNEFSLQHELGLYLRKNLDNAIVLFEKNVKSFPCEKEFTDWKKHEIDIVILNKKTKEKYAIELKFPINGQYPEQMFQFLKDINFMEQVKEHLDFEHTFCLTLVNDSSFCSGKSMKGRDIKQDGIYQYFRKENNEIIPKTIINSVQHSDSTNEKLNIEGQYQIKWKDIKDNCKYYLLYI